MEESASQQEEAQFENLDETRTHDPNHARTGEYAAVLNAREHYDGPTATLKVKAGDSLHLEVFGHYDAAVLPRAGRVVAPALVVADALAGGSEAEATAPGQRPPFFRRLVAGAALAWTGLLVPQRSAAEVPQAYLRYDLYTKDSVWVKSEAKAIDLSARDDWQHLYLKLRGICGWGW